MNKLIMILLFYIFSLIYSFIILRSVVKRMLILDEFSNDENKKMLFASFVMMIMPFVNFVIYVVAGIIIFKNKFKNENFIRKLFLLHRKE